MKRLPIQFAHPASLAVAASALLAAVSIASLASPLGESVQASAPATGPRLMADAAPAHAVKSTQRPANADKDSTDSVEAHIAHLHHALQIKASQEDQWRDVADVMRDNAERITALAKARGEKAKAMTAVDDLKSYAEFAEAHEKAIEKLLPVFTKLYDGMSDEQKKIADKEFREHHHTEHSKS